MSRGSRGRKKATQRPAPRRPGRSRPVEPTPVGIAWYERDQYPRLREVSADPEVLEGTYDEWLATAERTTAQLRAEGIAATPVRVDVEELVEWCGRQGVPVDGSARAGFAAEWIRRAGIGAPTPPGSDARGAAGPGDEAGAGGVLARRMRRRDLAPRRAPDRAQWQRLYELADRVKAMAPWEWMAETDVFGVVVPPTANLVFASVLGEMGEHLAVAVYVDDRALYDMLGLSSSTHAADRVLEIPQVQLSFEDRDLVERQDRAVMKALNLTGRYRGAMAYPWFRCYRPGCAPWLIDVDEAATLECALEQLLDVAPRCRDGRVALGLSDRGGLLVREPVALGGALLWRDAHREVPLPPPVYVPYQVGSGLLARLRGLPSKGGDLVVGLFPTGGVIRRTLADRPLLAYALVVADPDSGLILAVEALTIDPDLEGLLAHVPQTVLEATAKAGARPRALLVADERLSLVLGGVCRDLGIDVKVGAIPLLDHIRQSMAQFMGS